MLDVISLAAMCRFAQLAEEKGTGGKLSPEEKELLLAGSGTGTFYLFSTDRMPWRWLRAGRLDFFDRRNPSVATTYNEAFEALCRQGLVSHRGGIVFTLSEKGLRAVGECMSALVAEQRRVG